ncbi:uncharacterized protein LOC122658001 [Telopea speciosissima]|uniref:uncharacterized protein LOC122658001 n=1 Tax=Telopea speciosissima TaxID=54955 RepID=UPI001CC56167|nr:uncharacterized protein LOC122658001 [Telopea speciosissima]XP_043708771.1 uncharacterized protein LOC122658001 [Telopea speciosissima]
MCNKGIGRLERSCLQSDNLFDQQQQQQYQAVYGMETPATAQATQQSPGSNEESPRVKFLCSFGGSILPRPQDGKLRYIGGETRIVSLPREITYEELMARMRELFDGAALLKYQQPDEDLDALVSVVNDDDVTNMMEEYDKLGAGDGFTRLRMFLFSHPDQDASSHFDTDERETERRYVDALNSLNDGPDFRKSQQQLSESPTMAPVVAEQYFNPISLEAGLHNQRNCEMPLPQFNLHHLTIPHLGSGSHQQSHTQRYNEMEAPWSPAYYSPRHHGHHDPRPVPEYPSSPSSGRYRMAFGELHDKGFDRLCEEYARQQVSQQTQYDHQPQYVDNVVWLPPAIPSDKVGFPANLAHSHNVIEGSNICEHCRMAFQRNQTSSDAARYPDSRWKHGVQPHLEQPSTGNEFHQFSNPCADCASGRDYTLNVEQNEARSFYNEVHSHERSWVLHNQLNHRAEEPRTLASGAGRIGDHYIVDGAAGVNFTLPHGNCCDGHHVSSNCINHEDPRYLSGPEMGNEGFHDQAIGAGLHIHIPAPEDHGVRYGNFPPAYGTENLYQMSPAPAPAPALWRKVQNPLHGASSYEPPALLPQANGTVNSGFIRGTQDGSSQFRIAVDNPNAWSGPSQKVYAFDGSPPSEYPQGYLSNFNAHTLSHENQNVAPDPVQTQPDMVNHAISMEPMQMVSSSSAVIDNKVGASSASGCTPGPRDNSTVGVVMEEKNILREGSEQMHRGTAGNSALTTIFSNENLEPDEKNGEEDIVSRDIRPAEEHGDSVKHGETDVHAAVENEDLSARRLSYLPELIASVKKAALESVEEVEAIVQGNADGDVTHDPTTIEEALHELESAINHVDLERDSDSDHPKNSKIEPTMAEEEALSKGLQTIKNDDLEEIRELGSGTYGAVYHGKWKGSDVAIKRIKASCFAGRPSERERLIADFWKEALILSSLHHPNVVSFYGIVRDGPDGSLATVTEFMVNGSLKQFLQKKDRTIDRRKRLILAMDAAFGMEYLHGKNIVHFDLKCENLLVNMRDPQRPVCKIGDLGLSKVRQHTLVSGGVRGTLPWMAPELLSGKSNMVTEKIDVYSFGIIMWELLTGEEPYANMHCASIIGGIVNNTLRPQVPTWCDPEWKSLMESSWASDPAERPSFSEISQRLRKMSAAVNVK